MLRERGDCVLDMLPQAIEYVYRYHHDPIFRAAELKRRHQLKLRDPIPDDGSLTPQVIARLFAAASRCPVCRQRMRSKDKSLDHIEPKCRGGAHSLLNVRVICKHCNAQKNAKLLPQLNLRVLL